MFRKLKISINFQPRSSSSARLSSPSPTDLVQVWTAFRPDLERFDNGQSGRNFLRALTNLVNVIREGKLPFELRPHFFGEKSMALKMPDGRIRSITVGNTFRRLSAKWIS